MRPGIGEMQSVQGRICPADNANEISFRNQRNAILGGEPPLNLAIRDLMWEQRQFKHHHCTPGRGNPCYHRVKTLTEFFGWNACKQIVSSYFDQHYAVFWRDSLRHRLS